LGPRFFLGFVVAFAIFVPLERLFALRREQKIFRRGFFNDVVHFLINNLLVQLGLALVLGLLLAALGGLVSPAFQAKVAAQPGWLQFVEAVLIAELSGYLAHRLCHRVPWLWRFHAVHHSIEEMDWLASARLHPIDQIFTRACAIVPLYLVGFTRETFGAFLGLSTLHAIFLHSNVRFRFGWLRYVIGTPEGHHWHHSRDPEAIDKNFSGQLPLLDWLFGTLYLPKNKRPMRYGVEDPMPQSYLKQLAHPFGRSSGGAAS
jgi:sterol desaturase/sphingolipid hydroxylase (fatty acid hydroxylase superfamily)